MHFAEHDERSEEEFTTHLLGDKKKEKNCCSEIFPIKNKHKEKTVVHQITQNFMYNNPTVYIYVYNLIKWY